MADMLVKWWTCALRITSRNVVGIRLSQSHILARCLLRCSLAQYKSKDIFIATCTVDEWDVLGFQTDNIESMGNFPKLANLQKLHIDHMIHEKAEQKKNSGPSLLTDYLIWLKVLQASSSHRTSTYSKRIYVFALAARYCAPSTRNTAAYSSAIFNINSEISGWCIQRGGNKGCTVYK